MTIRSRYRARGYIKGSHFYIEYELHPLPEEHTVIKDRVVVPTKAVALDDPRIHTMPVYRSDAVKLGEPILVDHGILAYHFGIYMHPTDYMWYRYPAARAHDMVMIWIDQRAEQMAAEAEARMDEMILEMERSEIRRNWLKRWKSEAFVDDPKWLKELLG